MFIIKVLMLLDSMSIQWKDERGGRGYKTQEEKSLADSEKNTINII